MTEVFVVQPLASPGSAKKQRETLKLAQSNKMMIYTSYLKKTSQELQNNALRTSNGHQMCQIALSYSTEKV